MAHVIRDPQSNGEIIIIKKQRDGSMQGEERAGRKAISPVFTPLLLKALHYFKCLISVFIVSSSQ